MGERPDLVDTDAMDTIIETKKAGTVTPPGHPTYEFRSAEDLVLDKKNPLPGHANGMSFSPRTIRAGC